MKRVRIFVDNSNLTIGWRKDSRTSGTGINWSAFPRLVMQALAANGFVGADADLRGVTVYASVKRKGEEAKERFLHEELDQLPSYTVRLSYRREQKCSHDPSRTHHVEKGVDTKIVCDMLALAMRDHYDLGVVVSDDEDLVPSIQCVQDIVDRQIVHLGLRGAGKEVRSASWGHITFDDMLDDLKGELRPGDNCKPRPEQSNERQGKRSGQRDHRSSLQQAHDTAMQQAMRAAQERTKTPPSTPSAPT